MAKKKSKKRRGGSKSKNAEINLICSLTGGGSEEEEQQQQTDTMDSLLAEMGGGGPSSSSVGPVESESTPSRGIVVGEDGGASFGESREKDSNSSLVVECPPPSLPPSGGGGGSFWDLSPNAAAVSQQQAQQERAKLWNEALRRWSDTGGGSYVRGLLPCIDVELTRHFRVEKLSCFLLKSCPDVRMPAFERWLIDSKLEDDEDKADDGGGGSSTGAQTGRKRQRDDRMKGGGEVGRTQYNEPILPSSVSPASESSLRLVGEMTKGSMSKTDAERIVGDLCRRTAEAVRELDSLDRRLGGVAPFKKKGERIEVERHKDDGGGFLSLVYHRKKWKKPYRVKMNAVHYRKLRDMFHSVHGGIAIDDDAKPSKVTHAFHLLVLCLLLRYSSLSGGQLLTDLRGGGMQGAVHPDVFRLLQSAYPGQPVMECFASPFNAYFSRFASAFPDLDWHFGGVGDFMEYPGFREGVFEANPPFSPGLMNCMVDRMECHLSLADRRRSWLTFVVIVPSAEKSNESSAAAAAKQSAETSFRRMISSTHCAMHITLPSREHGYVEGAQHIRPTRYKQSSYDTSVIVLQSEVALKEKVCADFEDQMRRAFASRHEEETKLRRLASK